MVAEIISVGDELLIGQVVNTNAVYIGQRLVEMGLQPRWITTVGDNPGDLRQALEMAFDRAEVVIVTGGLGPTHDDVTKEVVSDFFESPLVFDSSLLERIQGMFRQRQLEMPAVVKGQAYVPEKARIIPNEVGTAPGFIFEHRGKYCVVMPGVPAEMKSMMDGYVTPFLKGKVPEQKGKFLRFKLLRTTGILEAKIFENLDRLQELEGQIQVAFLPTSTGVDIRLTAHGESEDESLQRLEQGERYIRERIGEFIYGVNEETLEQKVAELFFRTKKTVAVAESCTGGLLGHKLTNVPGSSDYFERGVVAYSNRAKVEMLGVPEETLRVHGAVSEPTAIAMAEGVRRLAGTDFGISTTGIAGPGGGTPQKPVGLVYVGFADGTQSFAQKFIFKTDRLTNKERAACAALEILRRRLLEVLQKKSP